MTLRAASYNIRTGRTYDGLDSWPFRSRAVASTIRGLDADVVGLQEAWRCQLRSLGRRLPGYGVEGEGRDGGNRGEHCPVLFRSERFGLVDRWTRWYGDEPGGRLPEASHPRIATLARLVELADGTAVRGGTEVDVVCTHLDERQQANRERSATELVSWLDGDRPTVIVGDLNAAPDNAVLATLAQAGYQPALPDGAGGTAHRFTGRTDGPQIDHILVSRHFEVTDARVVYDHSRRRPASDHWPVVADLTLR